MNTGTKIAKLREKSQLSQREVAAKIGMTQPNYHKIESGLIRAKMDTVEKLASFFGVTVEDLRADEEAGASISQNNHNNDKVITGNQVTLNFTNEELVAMLKKQLTEKEEIIKLKDEIMALKDEKIKALEQRLGEVC